MKGVTSKNKEYDMSKREERRSNRSANRTFQFLILLSCTCLILQYLETCVTVFLCVFFWLCETVLSDKVHESVVLIFKKETLDFHDQKI